MSLQCCFTKNFTKLSVGNNSKMNSKITILEMLVYKTQSEIKSKIFTYLNFITKPFSQEENCQQNVQI